MFQLLRVIIRPSNEPTQDYLIPSALCNLYNLFTAIHTLPETVHSLLPMYAKLFGKLIYIYFMS